LAASDKKIAEYIWEDEPVSVVVVFSVALAVVVVIVVVVINRH